ncbi:substrate-binding periplasmic protein [Marinomonas atlantica]|uniref:substrate-binding periplasmic protein n=1 Tax=Marinomonas atlantica TaxID=1806668 RepID=UPI000836E0F8|nr:transporter substrate-binding domain-containing protein [Marinomonas atlantica]
MNSCHGYLFCLGFLLLTNSMAHAEKVVLYSMHFPPYSINADIVPSYEDNVGEDGLYGADIEIIRAAYASQNIEVAFKTAPWKRIMRDLEAGLILGAVSCRPIAERSAFSYFSEAVSYSTMVLATQKDFLGKQDSHPLNILSTYKNIVMAGWAQEHILKSNNINYSVVNGINKGVALLLHRNQDIFMTDKESLVYVLDKMDVKDQFSFYKIDNIDHTDYTVCFSKKFKHSEHLWRTLNRGLSVLRESGKIRDLYAKYGITNPNDVP